MTDADRREPAWLVNDVVDLLSEFSPERLPVQYERHKDGALTALCGYQFECGCTAKSRDGWTPCPKSVHRLLAQATPHSRRVREFRRLRNAFRIILTEAWRRRGRNDLEFEQYITLRYRQPLHQWQATHDLLDQLIVQSDGSLYADLSMLPAQQRIALYNGGSFTNVEFVLQLTAREIPMAVADCEEVHEIGPPIDLGRLIAEERIAAAFGTQG